MIDMTKTYVTRNGQTVRVLTTDRRHPERPVLALCGETDAVFEFTKDGRYRPDTESGLDLLERADWEDFSDGEPVMVRNKDGKCWRKRHFAAVVDGLPYTYPPEVSKWTYSGQGIRQWDMCRRPTPEEFASRPLLVIMKTSTTPQTPNQ